MGQDHSNHQDNQRLTAQDYLKMPGGGSAKARKSGFYVEAGCTGCGECYDVCPQRCIDIGNIPAVIDQNRCLHCGACMTACPAGAIHQY